MTARIAVIYYSSTGHVHRLAEAVADGAARSGAFLGLLSPVVATALGWSVLGQSLTAPQLAGAPLVLAAVVAPQLPRRSRSRPLPAPPGGPA